jgi:hypothetical protein
MRLRICEEIWLSALGVGALLAGGGCGGRAEATSVGAAGSAGTGSNSTAGANSQAGNSQAGNSQGGSSLGGAAGCEQLCPSVNCETGYHVGPVLGDCCPACILNSDDNPCHVGMAEYRADHAALVAKYQQGCQVDSDCTAIALSNVCDPPCVVEPVLKRLSESLQRLDDYAQQYCESCPNAKPSGACHVPAPGWAGCINGICVGVASVN